MNTVSNLAYNISCLDSGIMTAANLLLNSYKETDRINIINNYFRLIDQLFMEEDINLQLREEYNEWFYNGKAKL